MQGYSLVKKGHIMYYKNKAPQYSSNLSIYPSTGKPQLFIAPEINE